MGSDGVKRNIPSWSPRMTSMGSAHALLEPQDLKRLVRAEIPAEGLRVVCGTMLSVLAFCRGGVDGCYCRSDTCPRQTREIHECVWPGLNMSGIRRMKDQME